ncbi:MAG: hypothetical protein UY96_C0001G0037 [Parcubacteria group bacterium GW2011_GWB1_56_8]|nr:MAG: hypothetical protein UY96_C0001G0037 [Parcubacteria group bacterium GW2011_GWB1_56_8]
MTNPDFLEQVEQPTSLTHGGPHISLKAEELKIVI